MAIRFTRRSITTLLTTVGANHVLADGISNLSNGTTGSSGGISNIIGALPPPVITPTGISLSATSVTLPNSNVGASVATVIVTATGGTYSGPVTIGGTNAARFTLSNGGSYPCNLLVGATSLTTGTYNITLTAGPITTPFAIAVTVTAITPTAISLSATAVTLPVINVGALVATITITATGGSYTGPVTIGGTDAARFTLSNGGIYPCNLVVGGTSLTTGSYNISLTASPITTPFALAITITITPTGISLSATSVTLPPPNANALVATITITASGGSYTGPVTLGGTDAAKFALSNGGTYPCNLLVGPTTIGGAIYNISLTATPITQPFSLTISNGAPAFVPVADGIAADVFMDFANGNYYNMLTSALSVTRAQTNCSCSDLLPASASGAAFQTFATANTLRITPNAGLLAEYPSTNFLFNSTAPATQTTPSLAAGSYILWVNGSGSAAVAAGTAVGTGFGTATQGTAKTFTITTAGTVVVTVTGTLNAFQLEPTTNSVTGSSLIITTGATGVRGAEAISAASPTFGAAYAIYAQGSSYDVSQGNRYLLEAGAAAGSISDRISCLVTAGLARPVIEAGATIILSGNLAGALVNGTAFKVAATHASGDNAACCNAGAITSSTTAGTPAAFTVLGLGRWNNTTTTDIFGGYLMSFAIWLNHRVSNTGLQTLTTLALTVGLSATSVTFPSAADANSFVATVNVTVASGTYAGTLHLTGADAGKFALSNGGVFPCNLLVGASNIAAGTYNISITAI